MPQNKSKYTIERLKGGFNRALPLHQYERLVNFVIVKKLLAECPGEYVCYRWYHDRIAVATSEPDINEWLKLHGLSPQEPIEITYNRSVNRKYKSGHSKGFSQDAMVDTHRLQAEIVERLDNGSTLSSLAEELNCTPANIHYHRRKYLERMAKELEVDN